MMTNRDKSHEALLIESEMIVGWPPTDFLRKGTEIQNGTRAVIHATLVDKSDLQALYKATDRTFTYVVGRAT